MEAAQSRGEIENLLHLYAERIDLGDFDGVAELFAHGAIGTPGSDQRVEGREAVLELYRKSTRLHEDGTPATKHVTTNAIIEIDAEAGLATCRSYFTVFQALNGFPLQPIIAGRYHDTFERCEEHWRFKERIMIPELFGDLSRHLLIEI